MRLDRTNTSFVGRWWWTVDHYLVIAIVAILSIGTILVMASSPAVAHRIGVEPFYFIHRQIVFIIMAITVMFFISLMSPVVIRRFAALGFATCMVLMVAVLFIGTEIKGARRWISIAGFSLQPSEFAKTFFLVLNAWVLSRMFVKPGYKSFTIATCIYAVFAALLVLEPDFGTTVVISLVWAGQLFLAGLPWMWVAVSGVGGMVGVVAAYFLLPHVTARINRFFDPSSGDNYQVAKSLESFSSGGFFGRGPGQGVVKEGLPDSHTDFIFAVAGEELGLIACMVIIALFAFIVIRGFIKMAKEEDIFVIFSVSGLLMQFGLQALINMSVALHLVPTKGMTMPFVSYGGSSMLSVALAMGIILALTRKRYGVKNRITNISKLSLWTDQASPTK